MNEYEIYSYESYKRRVKDDLKTIDEEHIKLFDEEKYDRYIKHVKEERENLSRNVQESKIGELMGLSVNGIPTLASVLVFSKYPQAYYPQYTINAISVPGTEKGYTGPDGERFIDNKKITGPIDEMIEEGMNFVRKNIKFHTIINNQGKREDRYEYPLRAIREALINALVHRDYSRLTEGTPVSLEIYSDRIEITNPGELYGGSSASELGIIRPETRNMILANLLEILHVTENRYSGIPTIRMELADYEMPAPIFVSKRGEFKTIIKKEFESAENSIENRIIFFCRTPRTRDEIVSFVGLSKNHVTSKMIQPLVENGKLFLTIPEKPRSSFQKYYSKQS